MAIKIDTREFEAALKAAILNTKRDSADVLNGHAIGVITKAAKLTMKADPAKIDAKLYSGNPPLIWLILNARQKRQGRPALSNKAMKAAAKKFLRSRILAIGFTAYAGWQNALLAVGGRGFGSKAKRKGFSASSAAGGSGKAATVASMMARISNTAAWIEHIGQGPLQEALNQEAAETMRHLEEKLAKHCKAASR